MDVGHLGIASTISEGDDAEQPGHLGPSGNWAASVLRPEDGAASGVTWKRCLSLYRSSTHVCSGVGVSGEIGQVPPGRHVCVSASAYQGQG